MISPHPVLLQHLSIDRFKTLTSEKETDPVAEDAFCASLKKIGATWWRSHFAADFEVESHPELQPDYVYTGWPTSGGVWFLKLTEQERLYSKMGMLANALNMEEYCKVLEMNGATFYEDPKDCEYLRDVI